MTVETTVCLPNITRKVSPFVVIVRHATRKRVEFLCEDEYGEFFWSPIPVKPLVFDSKTDAVNFIETRNKNSSIFRPGICYPALVREITYDVFVTRKEPPTELVHELKKVTENWLSENSNDYFEMGEWLGNKGRRNKYKMVKLINKNYPLFETLRKNHMSLKDFYNYVLSEISYELWLES